MTREMEVEVFLCRWVNMTCAMLARVCVQCKQLDEAVTYCRAPQLPLR